MRVRLRIGFRVSNIAGFLTSFTSPGRSVNLASGLRKLLRLFAWLSSLLVCFVSSWLIRRPISLLFQPKSYLVLGRSSLLELFYIPWTFRLRINTGIRSETEGCAINDSFSFCWK